MDISEDALDNALEETAGVGGKERDQGWAWAERERQDESEINKWNINEGQSKTESKRM